MTERLSPRPSLLRETRLWYGAAIVVLTWVGIMMILNFDIFAHSPRDSYTLQALAWREGKLSLGQDYPWLELAIYEGDYYVSFPSVPALVMWLLTFFFGENTPNTLVTGLYFLTTYFAGYALARRFRKSADAMFFALFLTLGCNMLQFSLTGDVWNQAQLMCFMLTTLCALGLTGEAPLEWALGLFCLALSVGCRPFQAAFVPPALWMLYKNISRARARAPRADARADAPPSGRAGHRGARAGRVQLTPASATRWSSGTTTCPSSRAIPTSRSSACNTSPATSPTC